MLIPLLLGLVATVLRSCTAALLPQRGMLSGPEVLLPIVPISGWVSGMPSAHQGLFAALHLGEGKSAWAPPCPNRGATDDSRNTARQGPGVPLGPPRRPATAHGRVCCHPCIKQASQRLQCRSAAACPSSSEYSVCNTLCRSSSAQRFASNSPSLFRASLACQPHG